MKPIIFLDISGVITKDLCTSNRIPVSSEMLSRIKRLVDETNGDIVIISSWRYTRPAMIDLQKQLHMVNVETAGGTTPTDMIGKVFEIFQYLDLLDVKPPYVIIDDDCRDIMKSTDNFVNVASITGLTDDDVDRAISIIKKQIDEKSNKEIKIYGSIEDSHAAYKKYVDDHISAVKKCCSLYGKDVCDFVSLDRTPVGGKMISPETIYFRLAYVVRRHDESKYSDKEFSAYAAKFYPTKEDIANKEQVEENAHKAFEHHYKHNAHHPEFWKLNGKIMHMLSDSFAEMIIDWIAMSYINNGSLYEWWFNNGRADKIKHLPKEDIGILDSFITKNKDKFDFR